MRHMKCFPGTAIKMRPCPGLRMPAAYPNHYKTAYLHGTEYIRGPADMDLFRPGIDTRLLLEEINGYLLSCYWKMFSTGELNPDSLEKDFLKRVGQWKRVYLKERNH